MRNKGDLLKFLGFLAFLIVIWVVLSTPSKPLQDSEQLRSLNNYSFWETRDSKEYTDFLNELDSDNSREIISVSNSSFAFRATGPYNLYTVIYKTCEDCNDTNVHYEYSIFEPETEEEFTAFLDTIGDEFEIFDISIGSYSFEATGPYHTFIVTYRKAL